MTVGWFPCERHTQRGGEAIDRHSTQAGTAGAVSEPGAGRGKRLVRGLQQRPSQRRWSASGTPIRVPSASTAGWTCLDEGSRDQDGNQGALVDWRRGRHSRRPRSVGDAGALKSRRHDPRQTGRLSCASCTRRTSTTTSTTTWTNRTEARSSTSVVSVMMTPCGHLGKSLGRTAPLCSSSVLAGSFG